MKAFDGFLISDDLCQLLIIECWDDSNEFRAILLDPGLIHLKQDVSLCQLSLFDSCTVPDLFATSKGCTGDGNPESALFRSFMSIVPIYIIQFQIHYYCNQSTCDCEMHPFMQRAVTTERVSPFLQRLLSQETNIV